MGIEGNTDNGLERIENTTDSSKTEVQEFIDQMPDELSRKHEDVTLPDEITRKNIKTEAENLEEKIEKQNEIIAKVESGDIKLETTQEKGNYGEMKTDQKCRELGYIRISQHMITDLHAKIHQGLDGLYMKTNPDESKKYITVDSKFGSAQLSDTQDGKQMSLDWIDKRLNDDVEKETAKEIRKADPDNLVAYVAHVDEKGNVTFDKLDDDGNVIKKGCEDL